MATRDDTVDMTHLYASLLALETAEDELTAAGERMDNVATELLQATASVVAMRRRIRRLRNPYFAQRIERFHATQGPRNHE